MSDEPERWLPIWDGPGFQVSWDGNFRSLDRTSPSGRRLKGKPLPTRLSNRGYVLVDYQNADGKRVTRSAHSVVLENFAFKGAPIPEGVQSRHYDDVGTNNRWRPGTEEESRKLGGNLFTGNGSDQHRDKIRNNNGAAPPVPAPAYDCINHAKCGGRVRSEGRRCVPCVEQVGREAADMLRSGENLLKVAQHFNYTGTDWVFSLAQKHGSYRGTKGEASTQRPKWSRRVAATVRKRLGRGDAQSRTARQSAAEAGTAPFGRVSHRTKLGQSGQSVSQEVTQSRTPPPEAAKRDIPVVTERDRHPYPADLVRDRPSRTRGGTSRRSR